jgi:ADP-heptose:LPS heptosyltransferase
MHFVLEDKEETEGREILSRIRHCDGPIVLIAPISTTTNMRALLPHQLSGLVRGLLDRGMCPVGLHSEPIPGIGVPVLDKLNIRQYMAVTAASDYVVSIDTGTFHCANGFHKPTLAIFTSADGFVYGKYFPEMELVQKHRSTDPQWTCGPCYTWPKCQKTKEPLKPCLTELTAEMMLAGWDKLVERYPK